MSLEGVLSRVVRPGRVWENREVRKQAMASMPAVTSGVICKEAFFNSNLPNMSTSFVEPFPFPCVAIYVFKCSEEKAGVCIEEPG